MISNCKKTSASLSLLYEYVNVIYIIIIIKMFKGALYYKLENMTIGLAPSLRRWGQQLYRSGMAA